MGLCSLTPPKAQPLETLHAGIWRFSEFDSLPSTSDFCIARAESGEPEGLAVLARSQSAPRGSRGRGWSESKGTLAFSVLLRPENAQPDARGDFAAGASVTIWPFLAALAFHDALCLEASYGGRIRLKWPNDIMLDGRKLGGVLVERGMQAGHEWLVIGFGANLASRPELADRNVACLAELGAVPEAATIAKRLLDAISFWRAQAAGGGFACIRTEWLRRAHPSGTLLAVETPHGPVTGSFSSIAEDGTLLLTVAGSIQRISTGRVLLLQEA